MPDQGRETRSPSWLQPATFWFAGREYRYFFHYHNCGWPPNRCTERIVELALADYWLDRVDTSQVLEVGAVTPYYWPHRVPTVVDPADGHRLVTRRCSLFDVDFGGRSVLSISTLEHVGQGQYGQLFTPGLAVQGLAKIMAEAANLLITIPVGFNPELDAVLFAEDYLPPGLERRFMVRKSDEPKWLEEKNADKARLPYGCCWADSIVILERGHIL
jgi:hypothetical protein